MRNTTRSIRNAARPSILEQLEERRLMTVFGGVEFPQGLSSFADTVIAFNQTQASSFNKTSTVLGAPQAGPGNGNFTADQAVSLGRNGFVTVGFTDNVLTNNANKSADLWVFETGAVREGTKIFVRAADAQTRALLGAPAADGFYAAGSLKSGGTEGLDIDAAFPGFAAGKLRFDAVKVQDDGTNSDSFPPGADIDAVGAISSQPVAAGKDYALKFDGVNDVAKASDSSSLNEIEATQKLTVEAIVKVDSFYNGWFSIVDKTDSSGFGWTFQIRQNEGIELTSVATGTMRVNWNPVIGQTYHLAATYDRHAATFYVNGKAVGSVSDSAPLPNTNGALVIGSNPSGSLEFAKGSIDELRLWSRVRTASEIQANYLKALSGTETNLVGYWRFNEGSGSIAHDLARGNNLVLGSGTAAPAWVLSTRPQLGSISGSFFKDANHDGVRQSSESTLAGWQVYLDTNKNGVLDTGETVVSSNASGNYSFSGLSAGTYQVREVRPNGWVRSKPSGDWPAGLYTVVLSAGQSVGGKDFGNYFVG